MTREQINQYREDVKHPVTGACFYSVADNFFFNYLQQCIRWSLKREKTTDMILNVHCSPDVFLSLIEEFWSNDFNYIGTRIKLIPEDALQGQPTLIPGIFTTRQTIIVLHKDKPVAFIEHAC